MAKLRHIAMAVSDLAKTASFYEDVFEMSRVRETNISVTLTDGTINLVLIDNAKFALVEGFQGLHHFGFVVGNLDDAQSRIEARGGVVAEDGQQAIAGMQRSNPPGREERKFRDPEGLNFDIVNEQHAREIWHVPL